jgi:hypothetical protein
MSFYPRFPQEKQYQQTDLRFVCTHRVETLFTNANH